MITPELIARTRMSAFLDDSNTDFTDTWITNELNDQLTQLYERAIVNSREGYWLKNEIRTVTQGQARYTMPKRACNGGLHRVEISYDSQASWCPLDQLDELLAMNYEMGASQQAQPVRFVVRGDEIVLLPTPNNSTYVLRIFYYLKPNRLTPAQLSANSGYITTVNPSTGAVTLSNPISSYDTAGASTSVQTGLWAIDIISGYSQLSQDNYDILNAGWHEVKVVSGTSTVTNTGLTHTFAAGTDLSNVGNGDRVRVAGQTEWPCIPADFHRSLCDATAAKILKIRSFDQKAAVLEASLAEDLARFGDLLKPRVQTSAKVIVAPQLYRGARRGWLTRYP